MLCGGGHGTLVGSIDLFLERNGSGLIALMTLVLLNAVWET
jgi:hypothetical protein